MSAQESRALSEVRTCAAIASDAESALVAAVRAAVEAGEPVAVVARAAMTTRPRIYRMLRSDMGPWVRDVPPESSWASTLDEAMMDLLGRVGSATADQLQAGLSSRDLAVKVRRFELGLRNAAGPSPKMGSEEWGRIVDAQAVVGEMRRHKMAPPRST